MEIRGQGSAGMAGDHDTVIYFPVWKCIYGIRGRVLFFFSLFPAQQNGPQVSVTEVDDEIPQTAGN